MSHQSILDELDVDRYGKIEGVTTRKQARMMDNLIEGKPPQQAALEAGFGVGKARTPWKLIDSSELRRRFQEVADARGLTTSRIADKITEHLDARANQTLEGKQVTQSDAPDYKVQQKALDQLSGLLGLQDAQRQSTASAQVINIVVTGAAAVSLGAFMQAPADTAPADTRDPPAL